MRVCFVSKRCKKNRRLFLSQKSFKLALLTVGPFFLIFILFYCLTEHSTYDYSTRYYLGIATYRADINYCTRRKLMFLQYYSLNVHTNSDYSKEKKGKKTNTLQ